MRVQQASGQRKQLHQVYRTTKTLNMRAQRGSTGGCRQAPRAQAASLHTCTVFKISMQLVTSLFIGYKRSLGCMVTPAYGTFSFFAAAAASSHI